MNSTELPNPLHAADRVINYLGENEVLNNQLVEILPIPIYTCDAHGVISSYNKAAIELWGRQPVPGSEYWCGAWKAFNSDGTALTRDNSLLAALFKGEKSVPGQELIIERPDGSRRYVAAHPKLLKDSTGRIAGAVNILLDITEKKIADENSALLSAIVHSTDDAIISKTLDGIVTSWNPGAEKLFGYKTSEIVGQSITKLIPEDRLNEEKEIIEKLKRGERVDHFDTLRQHKEGHLIDISLTISPVKDHSGRIIGASKIARNITIQKSLYQTLHQSEKKFRELTTQAPVGIIILRTEKLLIEVVNAAYLQIIDKMDEDLVGKSLFEVLPETRETVEEILLNVIHTGIPYYGNEFKVKLKRQGLVKWAYFNFVYQALRDHEGKIDGVIVVANEVTELIEAKHAQLETERKFRQMVMSSPVAMTIFRGNDHVIELANHQMLNTIWQKDESEVIGKKALEVFPELRQQKYPELLNEVLTTGKTHSEKESIAFIQREDSLRKFYLDFEYSPLYDAGDTISGIMITVNDVTDRVEARQKVEDAEARLRLAAEGTGLATWDLDLQTREIIYTPRLAEIFGFDRSRIMTHEDMRSLIHPDDQREVVAKAFERALRTGVYFYEARIIWADQSVHWIHTRGHVIYDENNRAVRMLGTMMDITEQKLSSQALGDSEQRLNIALEAAELGTWELRLNPREIFYSKRYLQILGFETEERPDHEEILECIHPDDRLIRNLAIEEAMRTGVLDTEMRIITKTKELKWIRGRGKVFYDAKGQPQKLLGTTMDITEQKKAFQILQESEERFKTVADGAPVMIWMSGTDRFLDYFNTTWLNFTGKGLEEESGEGWLNNVHPDDKKNCIRIYNDSFERKKPFHIEYRLRRYDGVYRWISDNAVPRYTPDGNFIGFISACMDIDEEKRINQRLQESELLFNTISNVSPVGLWMTNAKGENNFVNGTWIEWTGIPLYEQYGGGWLRPLLEEDREASYEAYIRQSAIREKFSAEFRFRRSDGNIRWALSEGFPYYDNEGNFAGYAGSVSDITERKQNELLKNEFLAVASHELKTPITSIKAYTQLLAQTYHQSNDVFLKNALTKVENQVNKMSKLVSDFLNLSKIESDKFQLNREVFSMNQLVAEVVTDIQMVSPGYRIHAELGSIPVNINADKEKIMQVLTNLLNNAVKYSPENKKVDVILERSGKEMILYVKDRGIGIKPGEYDKIFERFYRADTNNIHVSGFGIGLYISAEIIKKHGGQIAVKENEEKGSCFYFKLPISD